MKENFVPPVSQAVILAGGYGTRLKPFTDSNPKPMYPFEGKPFLEYLLRQVRSFGIRRVLLLLGYLPEKIIDFFGDGSRFGLEIEYNVTPVEYETGMRLRAAKSKMDAEFLLLYCDNYCPIDFPRLARIYRESGAKLCLTAYANRDGYTRSNLRIAPDGRVEVYDKARTATNLSGVEIGYALARREVLDLIPDGNDNFEKAVYPQLVAQGTLYACVTEHRYYSVGSWERIELTRQFFSPRRFVFLDRDGTLNVKAPRAYYVTRPEDFIWLPGAREAVKLLKDAGYTVLLFTNQPGIARGAMTQADLDAIHEKMRRELREAGADIDGVYCCLHNWDDGCFCRKPKPGLLYQAQREWSCDLTRAVVFGDDERDMQAGAAAGCRCEQVSQARPLLQAVQAFLKEEEEEK